MKAISTRYHGPTNTRGSRITADDGDGNRITVSYNDALNQQDAHASAACALCRKMGWETLSYSPESRKEGITGELIAGATKDGYVFVFAESSRYDIVSGRRTKW